MASSRLSWPRRPPAGGPCRRAHSRTLRQDGAMAWAWTYLGVSALGALLVLNAFRPLRAGIFVVQSFFAGWYTAEMPIWHIVWQVAATVIFGVLGAFDAWPGWLGLGIAVASWVGLAVH